MTEAEELQKIKAVVAKPTEEGVEQLLHLMEIRWQAMHPGLHMVAVAP